MSQQVIGKIVDMLSDERIERRCAAAMVLGELRVKDERAVDRLCACLAEEVGPLHLFVLEALAAMQSRRRRRSAWRERSCGAAGSLV